jgi:ABC-2 type transport system ATP-binding protein
MPFMRFFDERGIVISEARILHPSLEEVFVKVTGFEINKLKNEKEGKKK